MPRVPGVNHLRAVVALQKAGFRIANQGKHIKMERGQITLIIPRHNPIDPFIMGSIVRQAGLTVPQFRDLL